MVTLLSDRLLQLTQVNRSPTQFLSSSSSQQSDKLKLIINFTSLYSEVETKTALTNEVLRCPLMHRELEG
jgi:hypothetical protein